MYRIFRLTPARLAGLALLTSLAQPLSAAQGDLPDSAITQLNNFHAGMAAIRIRGAWGFVDRSGKMVIEPQFDEVEDFSEGLAAVSIEEKWGFVDQAGKLRVPIEFTSVDTFYQGRARVKNSDQKWGYLDADGHWAIPPGFKYAERFVDGLAMIENEAGRVQLIDRSGKVARTFDPEYRIHDFTRKSGVLVATKRSAPMLLNSAGQTLPLPAEAENFDSYSDGLLLDGKEVDGKTHYGAMDLQGHWVVAPTLKKLQPFQAGLAIAETDTGSGLIDKTGKFVVAADYQRITRIKGGQYLARRKEAAGIDVFGTDGRRLFASSCARLAHQQLGAWSVFQSCDATWVLGQDGKLHELPLTLPEIAQAGDYLLIQATAGRIVDGRISTPFTLFGPQGIVLSSETSAGQYNWAMLIEGRAGADNTAGEALPVALLVDHAQGVAILTRDQRIVRQPEWRYDPQLLEYNKPGEAIDGPMIMKSDSGWGAIDGQGRWLIPPGFEKLRPFTNGVAQGRAKGEDIVLGRSGASRPLPAGFRFVESLGGERFAVAGEDESRNELRIEYDLRSGEEHRVTRESRYGEKFQAGLSPAQDKDKWGLINTRGEWVVPAVYDRSPEPLEWNASFLGWKTGNYIKTSDSWSGNISGLLSPAGKEIIKPTFADITLQNDTGLLETTARHSNGHGLMAPDGREILPADYDQIRFAGDGWLRVVQNERKGLMNARGEWILEPGPYRFYDLDRRPYSQERVGDEDAYIDIAGRISTPGKPLAALDDNPDYWDHREEEGRAGKSRKVYYGFDWKPRVFRQEDRKGKNALTAKYERAEPFSEQRAVVVLKGNLGVIDSKGSLILHSAWRCGKYPVLLDGKERITWPKNEGPGC
ncbi:MAG: WG repeat-containing protein [Azonexus sp.]